MPRLTNSVARYRKHRPSSQAVVTPSGQDFYLGPHGTKVSHLEYDRHVAEWLARGRRPITDADAGEAATITVVELIAAYKRFAESYYRKHGKVTNEVTAILSAAKIVKQLYGREPASAFGPLKLQAVQQAMILDGWSRKHINKQIGRVVRMFGWGVSQELVSADVAHALREVKGLHQGRTQARETAPVMPVEESVVNIIKIEHVYSPRLTLDIARVPVLELRAAETAIRAEMAAVVEGKPDVTKLTEIDLAELAQRFRLQKITFEAARDVFDQMQPTWKGTKEYLLAQVIRLVEQVLRSDRIAIRPASYGEDDLRRRIMLTLNMNKIVQHIWEAIRFENTLRLEPVFDSHRPIARTADMRPRDTSKPCERTRRSHINVCVFDSTWEATEAFELDREGQTHVQAWAKNDGLGFEVHSEPSFPN